MPSSNRVIKASSAASGSNKAMIATEYELPKLDVEDRDEETKEASVEEDLRMISIEKSEKIIKEAELKSQQLLEATEAEIEEIKETAYASSYKKGNKDGLSHGYEKGYETGYTEGYEKAEVENREIRERAVQMLHEAHEAVQVYQSDRKEEFLKLAAHMAEKIVHDYIDQAEDGLLAIAKPFFYQLDKEEEFVTISVHPEKREKIEENLDEIKSISPGTRFMILGDPSLANRGMLIESSHAVVDLQIRNQLDRMLEEFQEMERTVDA